MIARQNDSRHAFPGWFKDVIYLIVIVVGAMIAWAEIKSQQAVLDSRMDRIEKMFSDDVKDIERRVDDIYKLLYNDHSQ